MKANIQAVLLDMDGTIVDAFAPIVRAMQQTLKEFSLPPMSDLEIRRHTGQGDCSMKALFGEHQEAATQRFLDIHDEDYVTGVKALHGAENLLHDLQQRGIPVAIVTSKGQHRAEAQLQHLGWLEKVHTVIGTLSGRAHKPNPEPLFLAANAMQVPIQHTVMIGDGIADMKAAVRAQSYAVGLTTSFSAHELQAAGAQQTFATLPEVHQWLQTQIH